MAQLWFVVLLSRAHVQHLTWQPWQLSGVYIKAVSLHIYYMQPIDTSHMRHPSRKITELETDLFHKLEFSNCCLDLRVSCMHSLLLFAASIFLSLTSRACPFFSVPGRCIFVACSITHTKGGLVTTNKFWRLWKVCLVCVVLGKSLPESAIFPP